MLDNPYERGWFLQLLSHSVQRIAANVENLPELVRKP
jgi:hypothetical protein